MKKCIYIIFVYFLFIGKTQAQLHILPLPIVKKGEKNSLQYRKQEECLSLPFFDDFTKNSTDNQPDGSLWINKGVYINNHFAIKPPSFNIATLDGIDIDGKPYQSVISYMVGPADAITSQCIDISKNSKGNPVVISFYWQAEGMGEIPNEEDSLLVQAKKKDNSWITLWSKAGTNTKKFQLEEIEITNSLLYHSSFQFRFTSYGKLSGMYDCWNIDYIYVYEKNKDQPIKRKDRALTQRPSFLLKNFVSMPIQHFLPDYKKHIQDSIYTELVNLSPDFDIHSHQFNIKDVVSGKLFTSTTGAIAPQRDKTFGDTYDILGKEEMILYAIPEIEGLNQQADSIIFEYTFTNTGAELQNGQQGFIIPTRNNDTLSNRTIIKDYFSYDDGSAEFGIGVRQQFGKIAVQFTMEKTDILTGVDIYFPYWNTVLDGSTFNLIVWESININDDRKDIILFKKNFRYITGKKLNELVRFRLAEKGSAIEVGKVFYIGIEQITAEQPLIGFDKNTSSGDKIFFNISNSWIQNKKITGSIMMRPVFNKEERVIGIEDMKQKNDITIFPNPCKEKLFITTSLNEFSIYQNGKQVKKGEAVPISQNPTISYIPLLGLPKGIYFIHFSQKEKSFFLKFAVE